MLHKIYSILAVAKTECRRIFFNPRIMIAGMLLIFIENLVIKPLIGRAEKMNAPLNIAEPFVAVGNSGALLLFIPSVFMILVSDFPAVGRNMMMVIPRTGRIKWLTGQLLAALFNAISYVLIIFAACCIFTLKYGVISSEWSDTVTKYSSVFPDEGNSYISEYLPSNLYNQLSFPDALLHTFLLLILYLFVLCLVISFFKILAMKTAGITMAFILIACGVITCSLKMKAMWLFPMANTISWLHYSEAFREPIKNMGESYLYFTALIVIGIVLNVAAICKADLNAMEEL